MSIRNLDPMFDPASVAVFGASARAGSLGATVWRQLGAGSFKGRRHAVNPALREIDGHPVLARAADLPEVPDLALICTPAASVPGLIDELGRLGTRAALVLSGGLDEAQRAAMLAAARPHLLRILGPGSAGLQMPWLGLNPSLAPVVASPGTLALVAQSGALTSAVLGWAQARGIGFSMALSLGEQADVDVGDMLDYLASDARTRAILLCFEQLKAARKFMSAARAAARNKPVIVVRSGHAQAVDPVYDAAIARAGMLRVDELQHLLLAAETLTRLGGLRGERLSIIGNGHGAAQLAVDAAAREGIELVAAAELGAGTLQRLQALGLRQTVQRSFELDAWAGADTQHAVLQALLDDPAAGALLFLHAPNAVLPPGDLGQALRPLIQQPERRLLSCWLGDASTEPARRRWREAGAADYATPEDAVRALAMLLRYRRNQEQLMEAPAAVAAAPAAARLPGLRRMVRQSLAAGADHLPPAALRELLEAYDIALAPGGIDGAPDPRPCMPVDAHVLRVAAHVDDTFGPVIEFGPAHGLAPHSAERVMALPPLNTSLARALVQRSALAPSLGGYADMPAADRNALHRLLVAVSQMLADLPEIAHLELAPLQLDPRGALVLEARLQLDAGCRSGAARFAIRPYPLHWVQQLQWQGRPLTLRPIRPEDEAQHLAFLARLAPEDIRLRVFYSRRSIERSELARLTQIDYEREFAFVAEAPGEDGRPETLGTVRAIVDPDNVEAEFGIIVRSDLKGGGLGELLMHKLIETLREHGTARLVATVLQENRRMLELAHRLGFEERGGAAGEGVRLLTMPLHSADPPGTA